MPVTELRRVLNNLLWVAVAVAVIALLVLILG